MSPSSHCQRCHSIQCLPPFDVLMLRLCHLCTIDWFIFHPRINCNYSRNSPRTLVWSKHLCLLNSFHPVSWYDEIHYFCFRPLANQTNDIIMSFLGSRICIVPVYLAIFYWSLAIFLGYLLGPTEAWSSPKPHHGLPFPPNQPQTETESKFDSSNFLTAKSERVFFRWQYFWTHNLRRVLPLA